ncbi:hypothetical protein [Halodesulfurarchaeum formicicum]|uniref:Uncharacterized protein n=1 Tax=Halodesulfurarchaeum formicicum TaxID=1873524 RepID=A0A1J1AEL8_9EURY|nr:hypothetical protein [Halodesulfurarchaeum formicicum]APE96243.1 hypothetical protein HSR6_1807 [Halodesulfurarchaeum formicicum]
MSEYLDSVEEIDNTFFRRGMVVAILYAIVDALIIFGGSPFIVFRLIGVVAAYYATRDMVLLREAGLDWGWTRYLVLVLVGAAGFLGYFFYAYRRAVNLSGVDLDPPESE